MKWIVLSAQCAVLSLVFLGAVMTVRAEECDNASSLSDLGVISGCISKFGGILDAIAKANATNAQALQAMQAQTGRLKAQIVGLDKTVQKLEKDIFEREVKVGVKEAILGEKVRHHYISQRETSLVEVMLAADSAKGLLKSLAYRQKLAELEREEILTVSGEIQTLNDQATSLKSQRKNLDALKDRVDKQAEFLASEVEKANKYVTDLSGKISALTTRQNALLAEKTGTYSTSVGEIPLVGDPNSLPTYNPGFSPAYAAFSFGAPHFKGMSQYGAFGRAKNGQNYKEILGNYYGNVEVRKLSVPGSIRTSAGTIPFEGQYLKGIAEMPTVWADQGGYDALKAQAVAARSYALAYVGWRIGNQNASGSICTSESCQVYSGSKAGNPGRWGDAVRDTEGEVLVSRDSGEIVNAWYASTSGGYQESYSSLGHTTPGFWDTTSDWTHWADGAWEVKGGSPWFYMSWYKDRSGKSCGRNHPWLKEDEFADIVNSALVYANGGDASGMFPEDVRSCWGGSDNPWSKDRMAQEAARYGGSVKSISSIRVEHSKSGITASVILQTDRGEVRIDGQKFQKAFNLRAPGALSLKSGLFNVEKK